MENPKIESNQNEKELNEKEKGNWLKDKLESIKNFFEGRKKIEENKIYEKTVESSDSLKNVTIDSKLDNLKLSIQKGLELDDSNSEIQNELQEFFNKGKEELKDDYDTPEEKELINKLSKSEKFKGRPHDVVNQIAKSATKIESEIKNWKQEKNSVAKSLLKIVNWIMGSEK